MRLKMSKNAAELMMAVVLVATIPVAFFSPEIPTILVFIYGANTALLIYCLYFIGAVRAGERPGAFGYNHEQPKTTAVQPAGENTMAPARTLEQRSAQEIINEKLQGGAIEAAIDKKFDKMVDNVIDDLFGNYGDISKQIKNKLTESMNPYIEEYDFNQHNVKLELLLNEMVKQVTNEQSQIVKNTRTLMGLDQIGEITATALLEEYAKYCGENVETSKLEIDTDDEPSYQHLTVSLTSEDKDGYSDSTRAKTLSLACEEDPALNIDINLMRWVNFKDDKFHITSVERDNKPDPYAAFNTKRRITSLENPVSALKNMDDFELFLIKLHQDHATIILDEEELEFDDVEVKAEPEYSLS